jgi:beta-aspartyl-dipeptidase (metallo-type)
MFTVIQNGEIFGPEPQGKRSILLAGDKIARIGEIDPQQVQALGPDCEVVEAGGYIVTPGLIDPHEHLIGAGGEEGFATRVAEVSPSELLLAGITTVVGCLGTDTVTRKLETLLGKVKQLQAMGLTAYMYTGGFQVPTPTITATIMSDLVLIDQIIGVGEIAISDNRSVEPTLEELAKLISSTLTGGMIGGKAGVTHFHVGPGKRHLKLLHQLLDSYELPPEQIYPTHANRSRELLDDAIRFAKRGAYIDMDTTEEKLGDWLQYYREHDGVWERLTISSDAHTASGKPEKLYRQLVSCVRDYKLPLEEVLPLFTLNTSKVLKLGNKGKLEQGKDADLLVLKKENLEIVHVFARGRQLVKNGQVMAKEQD